ncbi:MAG: hypothetical protein ACKORB_05610 [Opitutia bacterium]
MILLGIEGGGTRTTALLVDGEGRELASVSMGPGNVRLLDGEGLRALLSGIRDRLPARPARIGAGMAGVRTAGDRGHARPRHRRPWQRLRHRDARAQVDGHHL